jgi:hypothetical protein
LAYYISGYKLNVATNVLYLPVPIPSNFQKLKGIGAQAASRYNHIISLRQQIHHDGFSFKPPHYFPERQFSLYNHIKEPTDIWVVIPFPYQSALFVGLSSAPQHTVRMLS